MPFTLFHLVGKIIIENQIALLVMYIITLV